MTKEEIEKIRIRIMQEAYSFADDDNREAYNAIKVMCNDVLNMIQKKREWVGLTDEEGAEIWGDAHDIDWNRLITPKEIVKRIEAKLKEKNT